MATETTTKQSDAHVTVRRNPRTGSTYVAWGDEQPKRYQLSKEQHEAWLKKVSPHHVTILT